MTLGPVGSPTFWSFAASPLLSNTGNAFVLATDVAASGVCAATAALLAGSALEASVLQERYRGGPWTANAATQTSDASFLKSFSSNLKHAQKEGRGCYNVGKPCVSAAVWPWHAPIRTLGKNALLCSLFTMNKWMHTLLNVIDEQERGEEAEFPPFPDLKPSLIESFWLSIREMWVLTTRRVLEVWVYLNTSAQVRWKMLKDPWASIRRKHSRLGGDALRGISTVRQTASCWLRSYNRLVWCHVLQHAADFMVSACFSAWYAWGHAAVMGGRAPKHRAEYFARCVAKDALRIVGSLVMTWSVAATAAMTARLLLDVASPQVSGLSWLAMMGFDILWGMTVNEWLYPWIAAAM